MPLNRDQIRAKSKAARRHIEVPVPAFDGETVRLLQMTGGALVEYEALVEKLRGTEREGELAFVLLQNCGVDGDDAPLWEGEEGAVAVRELPGDALGLLAEQAAKLHAVTDETIEDAAKN